MAQIIPGPFIKFQKENFNDYPSKMMLLTVFENGWGSSILNKLKKLLRIF